MKHSSLDQKTYGLALNGILGKTEYLTHNYSQEAVQAHCYLNHQTATIFISECCKLLSSSTFHSLQQKQVGLFPRAKLKETVQF